MSTVLYPEMPSGSVQVSPRSRKAGPESAADPGRRRLDHVDLLRGLVMVIMVLDHVRAYLTEARFDPTDMARTDAALFATRWVTHYCAPIFIFLAGASAWIAGTRRTRGQLARFLVSRGLWLVLLELTLITFAWYFSTRMPLGLAAQVIWVIGASMVVLAGLIYLPRPAIAAFGLTLVLGHNLLDGIPPAAFGAWAPLWHVLHVPGTARGGAGLPPLSAGALGRRHGAGLRGGGVRASPATPCPRGGSHGSARRWCSASSCSVP